MNPKLCGNCGPNGDACEWAPGGSVWDCPMEAKHIAADVECAQHAAFRALRDNKPKPAGTGNNCVAEIVYEWLQLNGYSGLITEGCGCRLDDLFPCGSEGVEKCEPGYAGKSGYVYATWELAQKDPGPPDGEEDCV